MFGGEWVGQGTTMSAAFLWGVLPGAAGGTWGQARPGQVERRSGKAALKAKATQAGKLQNSAKGKVPSQRWPGSRSQGYLGVTLKFMTSARRTMPESVTQQMVSPNQGCKACDWPVDKKKKTKAPCSTRNTCRISSRNTSAAGLLGEYSGRDTRSSFLLWPHSHCWPQDPAMHRGRARLQLKPGAGWVELMSWRPEGGFKLRRELKLEGLGGATYLPKRNISGLLGYLLSRGRGQLLGPRGPTSRTRRRAAGYASRIIVGSREGWGWGEVIILPPPFLYKSPSPGSCQWSSLNELCFRTAQLESYFAQINS